MTGASLMASGLVPKMNSSLRGVAMLHLAAVALRVTVDPTRRVLPCPR
jgi:hypothetical protein